MDRPHRQIDVEVRGEVHCVRLRHKTMDEVALEELTNDFLQLVDKDGARKVVFLLGPEEPLCLYSVFLAKLVSLQRHLQEKGGEMRLAHASADVFRIFQACGLVKYFHFQPDLATAIASFSS